MSIIFDKQPWWLVNMIAIKQRFKIVINGRQI